MATDAQIRANRENGKLGGVKTPEGKAISRMNARKHGIFATALTEYDAADLRALHADLVADLRPEGMVEAMLVEKLAHTYLQLQRCALAESTYYAWTVEDEDENGKPAARLAFRESHFTTLVKLIGTYDQRLTNQFLRLRREIEQVQRTRERAPAPADAEVEHAPSDAWIPDDAAADAQTPADPPDEQAESANSPEDASVGKTNPISPKPVEEKKLDAETQPAGEVSTDATKPSGDEAATQDEADEKTNPNPDQPLLDPVEEDHRKCRLERERLKRVWARRDALARIPFWKIGQVEEPKVEE